MIRDYVKRNPPRKKSKKVYIYIWLTFLLLFFIFVSCLVMLNKYYYGRNIIPIISEPKAAAPSNITATKVISTPKFDFYNTLQQKEDLRKTKKPDDAYELEIAILDNFAAADRLKAELALLGFPASITPIYKQGIQKYYISTGPYDNKENAIIDAQKLKQNHIKSNLKKYLKSSLY